jgi:hypothetical protein
MSTTLTAPAAGPRSLPSRPRPRAYLSRWLPALAGPVAVACAATFLAALAYQRFLEVAPHLWTSGIHDRNAHYWLGLGFALDFRHGNILAFLHDVHQARVWTPLHALLIGAVLAVGGLDYRLAVLPSLAAWVGTAVFAFLTARRAVRQGGNLAGFTAALFVLASPAHQAFGTDIMLESLGACLSLTVLYTWLVAARERWAWSGRCLGLALSALFFHKYNYYLLVVLGLGVAVIMADPRHIMERVVAFLTRWSWRDWLKAQLRHPLTYVLFPVFVFVIVAFIYGGGTIEIAGRKISMNAPHNVVHIGFCLLFLRLLPWWWRSGRALVRRLEPPAQQLIAWHVWPVIVWFLWPQRLGYFLWYLTRDHGQEATPLGRSSGLVYYWHSLGADYHQDSWTLLVAVGLLAIAAMAWRSLRPGGIVVLTFVLVAAALTFHHPTHRSRFLHSWVAAGWVAAGIGLAQLIYSRWTANRPAIRPWLGAAIIAVLASFQLPGTMQGSHAPEGGPQADRPSVLDLTNAYLPALDQSRRPAVFANLPIRFLTDWTLRQRRQEHLDIDCEVRGFGTSPAEARRSFEDWLSTTKCDAIVLIDVRPESAFLEPVVYPDYRKIKDWLAVDSRYTRIGSFDLRQYACSATIWRRAD